MKMQTIGTMMALVGLILALVGGRWFQNLGPQASEVPPDIMMGLGAILVVVGIITSIVGRVKGGGPV